jgi:hypothetical protein
MALGTLDPLEGSFVILPGSGLVALGTYLAGKERGTVRYWVSVFLLIALGVTTLVALSSVGGVGGRTGRSMWWLLLTLPYPLGWLMALCGGAVALIRVFKPRRPTASA